MTCDDNKCPICKSNRPQEIIDHVKREIEKFKKDTNYKMKHYEGDEK